MIICEKYTSTHHDGVAIDGSLELREVRLHALVGRQGDVPHLDPEVVAGLFCGIMSRIVGGMYNS